LNVDGSSTAMPTTITHITHTCSTSAQLLQDYFDGSLGYADPFLVSSSPPSLLLQLRTALRDAPSAILPLEMLVFSRCWLTFSSQHTHAMIISPHAHLHLGACRTRSPRAVCLRTSGRCCLSWQAAEHGAGIYRRGSKGAARGRCTTHSSKLR